MSALILIFEPLGSSTFTVTIPPADTFSPRTVYEALFNMFDIEGVTKYNTWFLPEKAQFPTCSLQRTTRTRYAGESCGVNLEKAVYKFNVYSLYKNELHDILNRIEDTYDYSLPLYDSTTGRTYNSLHWDGRHEIELEPGIWYGCVDYLVYCEREQPSTSILIEADTLEEAITKRYNLGPIFNLSWMREKTQYPYISGLSFASSLRGLTTLSRHENVRFSFDIYDNSLDDIEEYNEKMINLYDAVNFVISEKTFLTIQYETDEILEIEPGIWKSTLTWNVVLEKDNP